jgi:hypothetical protein
MEFLHVRATVKEKGSENIIAIFENEDLKVCIKKVKEQCGENFKEKNDVSFKRFVIK